MHNFKEKYHELREKVKKAIIAFESGKEYQLDPKEFDEKMQGLSDYIFNKNTKIRSEK